MDSESEENPMSLVEFCKTHLKVDVPEYMKESLQAMDGKTPFSWPMKFGKLKYRTKGM